MQQQFFLVFCWGFFIPALLMGQNWTTQGGANTRNGQSVHSGPKAASLLWSRSDYPPASWGGATYTEGDRFVTCRYQLANGLEPTHADLVVADLRTGDPLFTFRPHPASVMIPLGIADNQLYAVDYQKQTGDTLYAIDLTTFDVLWKTPPICWTGITSALQFACNGDPILNGKVPGQAVMRLDKRNGSIRWANTHFVPIVGNNGMCALGNRLYTWEGSIVAPKKVRVIDLESGSTLFTSEELPGDGDQEYKLTVGPDRTVYARRDGGQLYALRDTGTGFELRWTYTFTQTPELGTYSNIAVNWDGSVYVPDGRKLVRLSGKTGDVLNTLPFLLPNTPKLMAIDSDSTLYVATCGYANEGRYYAFSADLKTTFFQVNAASNYYSGPAPGRYGILLLSGSGTVIQAYQTPDLKRRPAADFAASTTLTPINKPVIFSERCSYEPTNYSWLFPGGNPASATGAKPPAIMYSKPGIYEAILIAANAYGSDTLRKPCYLEAVPAVSTAEAHTMPLQIYPNPATDFLQLQLPAAGGWLRIVDLSGNTVFQCRQADAKDTYLSVLFLPAGQYVIFYDLEGKRFVARFILSRR